MVFCTLALVLHLSYNSHIVVSCGDSGDIRSPIICGFLELAHINVAYDLVILLNLWGQEILGHIFLWAVDILSL